MALDHLVLGLVEYATSEQGSKSVTKALKEGGKETLDRVIARMCEPTKGYVSSKRSKKYSSFSSLPY
jgi:pumilio RNA-binding family